MASSVSVGFWYGERLLTEELLRPGEGVEDARRRTDRLPSLTSSHARGRMISGARSLWLGRSFTRGRSCHANNKP